MSSNKMATKSDLQEMYSRILPYLGGSADAGFTPIGTIIAVFSETAPANYLICDGATYNKADYPELAAHLLALTTHSQYEVDGDSTKFKVPDLRGEFLRGTGTNGHTNTQLGTTEGSGANVGVHQNATTHVNVYDYNNKWLGVNSKVSSGFGAQAQNMDAKVAREVYIQNPTAYNAVSESSGYGNYTSRPTNTSVLFCIATKNIYLNPENDYSTDEKVIGTWIDGKTIYQKCIEIPETIPTANTTLSIILTAPANVDKYVYLGGWMSTGEAAYNSIPFSYEDTWFARLCGIETSSRHEILFNCRTTNTNAIRGVAIVQYTKTTS